MTSGPTAEVLGESAYDQFVKTNRRQMRRFELVLRESVAVLGTEETECDFVAMIDDRYRIVILALRK